MTALLTPEQVCSQVERVHERAPEARCIAFHYLGRWAGPDHRDSFQFYHCESGLEVRLALDEPAEATRVKVILTPLTKEQLGEDVLVRLHKRKLFALKRADLLKDLFSASQIDPRISAEPGLMEALVEYASPSSSNPAFTGSLSLDAAWNFVLAQSIGFQTDSPDLTGFLEWSCNEDNLRRLRSLSEERRELIFAHLGQLGLGAAELCSILRSGYDPLAAALVCGVVYCAPAMPALHKAEGKAEDRFFGKMQPTRDGIRKLAETGESLAGTLAIEGSLNAAEELLKQLGAGDFAYLSPVLRSGYEQRLTRLAHEMAASCRKPSGEVHRAMLQARDLVRTHRCASEDFQELNRIEMAIRLLKWNEKQQTTPTAPLKTLVQAAQEYAHEGSFADWARFSLIPGSRNRELEQAYREICQRVDLQRDRFSQQFARLLAGTSGAGSSEPLIPIEHVMAELVAPIAAQNAVLVVVIDGMSWSVWREISASLSSNWIRMMPGKAQPLALAAIPSVTELSRCSLFCGELKVGEAAAEVKGFKAHPALTAAGQHNRPPLLFHKAGLKSGGEAGLAEDVRDAIADRNRQVVGVVINAVDDNLLKGDQLVLDWSVERVHPLAALLEEGRLAGRHVIVLSDHGHVLELGSETRQARGGERWKTGDDVLEGECVVEGPRVLTEYGKRLIAPWSERVRYGPKRNGYHGGVSPQEMLIPVAVLRHESLPAFDLNEFIDQAPDWWETKAPAEPKAAMADSSLKRPKAMFEEAEPRRVSGTVGPAWLTALLKSPVLKAQAELAGRRPLRSEELADLLSALSQSGGVLTEVALCRMLKMAEYRLGGFIRVAQGMLNVEGYEVLSRDEDSRTVKLNEQLLKTQFELP